MNYINTKISFHYTKNWYLNLNRFEVCSIILYVCQNVVFSIDKASN